MDYLTHMQRRLDGHESFVPARLGSKHLVRNFAESIGVWTPTIYFQGPISSLTEDHLPREFVIKPSFASTSIGVMLLRKVDDGSYLNLLDNSTFTFQSMLENCMKVSKRFYNDSSAGNFIVEELLRDEQQQTPPQDIRFYAFQGEIGMVLKEEHLSNKTTKAMYFDGEFLPFPDVTARYSVAPALAHAEQIVEAIPPINWKALLAVAKRISTSVPSAFARIDLYSTQEKIYLGEITFYPGTFYYRNRKLMSASESERLGRLWDRATERLLGSKDPESLREPFTTGPTS